MRHGLAALLCFAALAPALSGQPRVDLRNTYERLLIVCPMRGAGTHVDPRRPLYAPAAPSRDGIIALTYQLSDDGKTAFLEAAARDRRAFAAILADRRPDVKVFEKRRRGDGVVQATFVGQIHVRKGFTLRLSPNGDYVGTGFGYLGLHPVRALLQNLWVRSGAVDPYIIT